MNRQERVRHVLFLIPSLQQGGAERVVVTLLRHLDRSRFRCSLAIVDATAAAYRKDLPSDVEFIDLQSARVRSALPKIISLLWRRKPDVVFSTLGHLNLALAMIKPVLPRGVRYVAREATIVSQLPNAYDIPRWWFSAYRRFYARFDDIVCQSKAMRDDLTANFAVPSSKIVVINNPVDVTHVRLLAQERVDTVEERTDGCVKLVAAGSLTRVKRFDRIIDAMALCPRPLQLTILGDGPLRTELQELASKRGLGSRVRFAGYRANPYAYFARADALVLSSSFEGFPNVALESLACGTPVIATPSPGGIHEILGGVDGCLLARDCSAEALADAFAGFQPGRRIPSGALEPYLVANIVARYEQLFAADAVIQTNRPTIRA